MKEMRNEETMEMTTQENTNNIPEYYDCDSSGGGMAKKVLLAVTALAVAGAVAGRKKFKAWNKKRVIAELEKEGCTIAYPVVDVKESEEPDSNVKPNKENE